MWLKWNPKEHWVGQETFGGIDKVVLIKCHICRQQTKCGNDFVFVKFSMLIGNVVRIFSLD